MICPNCRGILIAGETFFRKAAHDLVAFGLGTEKSKHGVGTSAEACTPPGVARIVARVCAASLIFGKV